MNYKTIKIPWFFGFAAVTVYPFIFHVGRLYARVKAHEEIHLKQQRKWCKWYTLWLPGLMAWFFLYLLVLPIGWNYFRFKWEYEAYTEGSKYTDAKAKQIIKDKYLLWIT